MRNLLLATLFLSLFLTSCEPPRPTERIETPTVSDSIPTIVLSDTSVEETKEYPIYLNVGSSGFHLEDDYTTIDRMGDVKIICITIQNDSIVSVSINNKLEFGAKAPKVVKVPFQKLDSNKILVLEGATLSYIASFYGKDMAALVKCNDIRNVNHIEAGTVLKLSCCYECN